MQPTLPIDVVVPAYNAGLFLRESLGSIISQTAGPARIIVVDDGSTDDTAHVATSMGATVVAQRNRGVAEARNAGIRAARSRFVAFLDADDRWRDDRLASQWRVIAANDATRIVSSDYAPWIDGVVGTSTLRERKAFRNLPRERLSDEATLVHSADMLKAITTANFILPSTLLVERSLILEHDLFFLAREEFPESDDVFVGEDYEWLLRLLRHADVTFVERVLVDYRMHRGSLSARRGRILYGDTVLARIVAERPDRYAPETVEVFRRFSAGKLYRSAIAHLHAGETESARRRFVELGRQGPIWSRPICASVGLLFRVPLARHLFLRAFQTTHRVYRFLRP